MEQKIQKASRIELPFKKEEIIWKLEEKKQTSIYFQSRYAPCPKIDTILQKKELEETILNDRLFIIYELE
jgi:hypothetical protein